MSEGKPLEAGRRIIDLLQEAHEEEFENIRLLEEQGRSREASEAAMELAVKIAPKALRIVAGVLEHNSKKRDLH